MLLIVKSQRFIICENPCHLRHLRAFKTAIGHSWLKTGKEAVKRTKIIYGDGWLSAS